MAYKPPSYNPLDYAAISSSLANALMDSPLVGFGDLEKFNGFGVYALFYQGGFAPYEQLSEQNNEQPGSFPIYIGKSSPGARKGNEIEGLSNIEDDRLGQSLFSRLTGSHRKSIEDAENLTLGDFSFKLLVLSYIWVPLAESALISRYKPVWNVVLEGFGNHAPGRGRSGTKKSPWDTLHPGRRWADSLDFDAPPSVLSERVSSYIDREWQEIFSRR